jgi:hypothetical protein
MASHRHERRRHLVQLLDRRDRGVLAGLRLHEVPEHEVFLAVLAFPMPYELGPGFLLMILATVATYIRLGISSKSSCGGIGGGFASLPGDLRFGETSAIAPLTRDMRNSRGGEGKKGAPQSRTRWGRGAL